MEELKLRRSMLFVPGISLKMITKGIGLPADSVILDLEDAVEFAKKSEARTVVQQALQEVDFGEKEIVLRINSLESEFAEEDLKSCLKSQVDTILLPKVNRPEDIEKLDRLISKISLEKGLGPDQIKIMAMMETPAGILNSAKIALASRRMSGFMLGAADLTKDTRAKITESRIELLFAMSQILYSARIAGIDAIDSPYFNIKNEKGLEEHTLQAMRLGYDGKAVIHPGQIEIVNRVFSPAPEEIERAKRIISAFEIAQKEGKGVTTVDGELIEHLHVTQARRLLKIVPRTKVQIS